MSSTADGVRNRKDNDPYNQMNDRDIRPDFLGQNSAAKNSHKQDRDPYYGYNTNASLANNARTMLRNIEQESANKATNYVNNVIGIRNAELAKNEQNGRIKGKASMLKKLSPVAAVILAIFFCLFAMGGATSILSAHIQAKVTEATNLHYSSFNERTTRGLAHRMKNGRITKRLERRFKKRGIEIGTLDASGNFVAGKKKMGQPLYMRYKDEVIDSRKIKSKLDSDINFKNDYYKAKGQRVYLFFNKSANKLYEHFRISRNSSKDLKSTGDADVDKTNYRKTLDDNVNKTTIDADSAHIRQDEDGNDVKERGDGDPVTEKPAGDTSIAKSRNFMKSLASKVADSSGAVCAVVRAANMASAINTSRKRNESESSSMFKLEISSRTKDGQGDAAVNPMLNDLSEPVTDTVTYIDENGIKHDDEVTGSALEASGMINMLTGSKVNINEARPYSLESVTTLSDRLAKYTGASLTGCAAAQAVGTVISVAISGVPGGGVLKLAVSSLVSVAKAIAITQGAAMLIDFFANQFLPMFDDDRLSEEVGIRGGHNFAIGAASINGRLAQWSSGYTPGSADRVQEQAEHLIIANAEEAKLDRMNRSPFDASSPNTFLGSLLGQFALISASTHTPMQALSTTSSVLSNALAQISPTASAANTTNAYISINKACPDLPGAVCDMYGMPIMTSDFSTLNISPDDPNYQRVIAPNLQSDGKSIRDNSELAKYVNFCTKRESPWGVQDANILDALQTDGGVIVDNLPVVGDVLDVINATEDISNMTWATGEACINSSSNPRWDNEFKYYQRFVEDMHAFNVIDGDDYSDEEGKDTDENMDDVTSNNSIEDILSGNYEVNPLIAFEDNYEQAHPLDNSYEGFLARISGYSKEDVLAVLKMQDELYFLSNYDPSDSFDFNNPNPIPRDLFEKTREEQKDETPSLLATLPKLDKIFIDKRNYLL